MRFQRYCCASIVRVINPVRKQWTAKSQSPTPQQVLPVPKFALESLRNEFGMGLARRLPGRALRTGGMENVKKSGVDSMTLGIFPQLQCGEHGTQAARPPTF